MLRPSHVTKILETLRCLDISQEIWGDCERDSWILEGWWFTKEESGPPKRHSTKPYQLHGRTWTPLQYTFSCSRLPQVSSILQKIIEDPMSIAGAWVGSSWLSTSCFPSSPFDLQNADAFFLHGRNLWADHGRRQGSPSPLRSDRPSLFAHGLHPACCGHSRGLYLYLPSARFRCGVVVQVQGED